MKDISIVIQAGGKSTRMGTNKALLEFKSTTLIEYIISQVKDLTDDLLLISNRPEDYQKFGFPVFEDEFKEIGPLAGIHSGLKNSKHPRAMVLGCDMPFHSKELIKNMSNIGIKFDVVIPKLDNDKYEPLRAIYSKNCLQYIEKVIFERKRRVVAFFDYVKVLDISSEQLMKFGVIEHLFMNINNKKDLELAENIDWSI